MNYQNFPPALLTLSPRLTKSGDPSASVVGINTRPLADGALVYCVENKAEYQLDKQDNATPPDGNTIIKPDSGPGRWKVFVSGGGGGTPRFTSTFYVDSGTAVPIPDQNGSVSQPYGTIQGAIDANLGSPLALALVGSNYPENVVVPAGTPVFFLSSAANITSLSLDAGAVFAQASGGLFVGDLTLGDGAQFSALSAVIVSNSVTVGDGCLFESFMSFSLDGTFTFGDSLTLRCFNAYSFTNPAGLVADVGAAPSNLLFMGSAASGFGNLMLDAPSVDAPGSYVGIVGGQNTLGTGYICSTLALDNAQILGGPLTCDTFRCNASVAAFAAVTTTGPVQITNSQVISTAPPWANALATPFVVDAYSNYWLKTSGTTLANLGEKVIANDVVP